MSEEDTIDSKKSENLSLAERLKALRMQKGLSQRKFSTMVDLNYTQYNRYEKGDRKPSTETIAKLADALDVSVDYLLDGEAKDAAIADMEDRELLQMFKEIEKFSPETKANIKATLNAYIKAEKLQQLAS